MLELNVCIGTSCHIKGAYNVIQTFQQMIEEKKLHDKINFKSSFCMKECAKPGVSVSVGGEKRRVPAEEAREFFNTVVIGKI
ncbi:(2Fe-2S) ferredoxin domain-containing protein [Treponema primitia]|uniref:(2Fe-2S) ferredoxin domain-containing protein n=1 Tax=Treponema primitia TaxID=88058 RepID=UPI00397F81EC